MGMRRFAAESYAELRKVEWPGRPQIISATVAVLIACIVVGAFLYGSDLLLRYVIEQGLLNR